MEAQIDYCELQAHMEARFGVQSLKLMTNGLAYLLRLRISYFGELGSSLTLLNIIRPKRMGMN